MADPIRLDKALVSRGLYVSRSKAAAAIAAGQVSLDGVVVTSQSRRVHPNSRIAVGQLDHYVSRAARKLSGALRDSATQVSARVLDAGASTGGFTQVLLENGAERVYAVDVGHGQLANVVANDPRVKIWEGVNLRVLTLEHVEAEPVDLVVADVSFISLKLILEPMLTVLKPGGTALLLVKPQFEVGRKGLNSKGVVTDETLRQEAVASVIEAAARLGWVCDWQGVSQVPGESGNVEYFVRLINA